MAQNPISFVPLNSYNETKQQMILSMMFQTYVRDMPQSMYVYTAQVDLKEIWNDRVPPDNLITDASPTY